MTQSESNDEGSTSTDTVCIDRQRPRLLIVHPSVDRALEMAGSLLTERFDVVIATTAGDALSQRGRFDKAWFCHELPDGSGITLAAQLLFDDRVENIRFL